MSEILTSTPTEIPNGYYFIETISGDFVTINGNDPRISVFKATDQLWHIYDQTGSGFSTISQGSGSNKKYLTLVESTNHISLTTVSTLTDYQLFKVFLNGDNTYRLCPKVENEMCAVNFRPTMFTESNWNGDSDQKCYLRNYRPMPGSSIFFIQTAASTTGNTYLSGGGVSEPDMAPFNGVFPTSKQWTIAIHSDFDGTYTLSLKEFMDLSLRHSISSAGDRAICLVDGATQGNSKWWILEGQNNTYRFMAAGVSNKALKFSGDKAVLSDYDPADPGFRWYFTNGERSIENGDYYIEKLIGGSYKPISPNEDNDGTSLMYFNGAMGQQWRFTYIGEGLNRGLYTIKPLGSIYNGKYLTVDGESLKIKPMNDQSNPADNQLFRVDKLMDDPYKICPKIFNGNKAVASVEDIVFIEESEDYDRQKCYLRKKEILREGVYYLRNGERNDNGYYEFLSSGPYTPDGDSKIPCADHQWNITRFEENGQKTDFFRLTPLDSRYKAGKSLQYEVVDGKASYTDTLIKNNSSTDMGQKWNIVKSRDNYYMITPVTGEYKFLSKYTRFATIFNVGTFNDCKWYIEGQPEGKDHPIEDGVYFVENKEYENLNPRMYMDVYEGYTTPGNLVWLYERNLNLSQQFRFKYIENSDGYYNIFYADESGDTMALTVNDSPPLADLCIKKYDSANISQQFKILPADDEGYRCFRLATKKSNDQQVITLGPVTGQNHRDIKTGNYNFNYGDDKWNIMGQASIEPGAYFIWQKEQGIEKFITADDSDYDNIYVWTGDGGNLAYQWYFFLYWGSGYYTISPGYAPKKCLSAAMGTLKIENFSGEDGQYFKILKDDDGRYRIVPKNLLSGNWIISNSVSGQVVPLPDVGSGAGLWQIGGKETISEGVTYYLKNSNSGLYMSYDNHVLQNGSNPETFNMVMQGTAFTNYWNQFTFEYQDHGYYKIRNTKSALYLETVPDNGQNFSGDGLKITLKGWNNNGTQLFKILPSIGGWRIVSKLSRDSSNICVSDESMASEDLILQRDQFGLLDGNGFVKSAAKWDISNQLKIEPENESVKNGGYFYLENLNSGMFVSPGSTSQLAQKQNKYHHDNDRFQFVFNADKGAYKIVHTATGKVLDVVGNYSKDGTAVQTYTDNGTEAQLFKVHGGKKGSPFYIKTNSSNGMSYVNIEGDYLGTNAKVHQWNDAGPSLAWKLVTGIDNIVINGYHESIMIGSTCQLSASITPEKATYKDLIWKSENTGIASVDQNGKVTAHAPGITWISARPKWEVNGKPVGWVMVEVEKPVIAVTGVSFNSTNITIPYGKIYKKLTATVSPEDATNKSLNWTFSNKTVATVNQNGEITPAGIGTTTITAKSNNNKYDTCEVTVEQTEHDFTLNPMSIVLPSANSHLQLEPSLTAVEWYSDNESVATVDSSGYVTAHAVGTAHIMAKTENNLLASCTVTVVNQAYYSDDPFDPSNIEYVRIKRYTDYVTDTYDPSKFSTVVTKSKLSSDPYVTCYHDGEEYLSFKLDSKVIELLDEDEEYYQDNKEWWQHLFLIGDPQKYTAAMWTHHAKEVADALAAAGAFAAGSPEYYLMWVAWLYMIIQGVNFINTIIRALAIGVSIGYSIYQVVSEIRMARMAQMAEREELLNAAAYRSAANETRALEIKKSLNGISYSNGTFKTAEKINEFWVSKGYDQAPYKAGTAVAEFDLSSTTKYVRVYGDASGMYGNWVMRAEEIQGLTATQIRNKFALPATPVYVCDVYVPAGTRMHCGIVNAIPEWGIGGGVQFDMNGVLIPADSFLNQRLLP